jgi:hypothetical protein
VPRHTGPALWCTARAYRPLEEIQLVQQEAFRYRSGGLVRRPRQRQDFVRPAGRQQRG